MNAKLLLIAASLFISPVLAADAGPADEIAAAAKALSEKANYAWKTTVVVPESTQFKPGPTEGKTEKDGFTYVTMSFGDNLVESVLKGPKAVIIGPDGDWRLGSELEQDEGPGRFIAILMKDFKAPGAQAAEFAKFFKEPKKEGDVYFSELTEAGAKTQFRFGEPKNPKASVKFWVKEGLLTKMEVTVKGSIDFGGNEIDVDRVSTTEIKEVGTTKVNVPEAAKKKLI